MIKLMRPLLQAKTLTIIIVAIVVLGALGLVLFKRPLSSIVDGAPSCPKDKQIFTVSPMALVDIKGIVPLGNLNPPGHTQPVEHMYLLTKLIKDPGEVGQPTEPVDAFAPGDIKVTTISQLEFLDKGYSDYSIGFTSCEGLSGSFIHLSALSLVLQDALDDQKANDDVCETNKPGNETIKQCWYDTNLTLKAGEKIGTVGGKSGSFGLDFSLNDNNQPPGYIANPERFRNLSAYNACGIDYFTAALTEQFYDKLGAEDGHKTADTTCGTALQDLKGTAQGAWFKQGSPAKPQNENDSIALVHDNIDPTKPVFSISFPLESIGIKGGTYSFRSKSSGLIDRDFADITPDGNVYCFNAQGNSGPTVLLLALLDETTLKVTLNKSTDCSKVEPTEDSVTFIR